MWLIGTYKDINNNTITVKIRNEKNGDNIELGGALVKFAAEDAVTIDCDRDDYFTHIIKKSATIRLVTRIYLGDYLWAANQKSVIVNILRNGKCVFAGYVTPNTYTQDYVEEWTTFDVNCRDLLSTLEDTNFVDKDKYDDFKQNAQTISLKDYLKLFGIMNANLNLDNYPQPMFMSHFVWITDGYIYQDGVFYAKLIEVEQVTIDGQVKNIATGNYKHGKVLEPNWILDTTQTTISDGLKFYLEVAYLDIDGNGDYETKTTVTRRSNQLVDIDIWTEDKAYLDVIEEEPLKTYIVNTRLKRTYLVDYEAFKAGDVQYFGGREFCPFELRQERNDTMVEMYGYVWCYYDNDWHKTNYRHMISPDIPVTPVEPNPDPEIPAEQAKDYLCFTSTGDSTVAMKQEGTPKTTSVGKVIQYKLNDGKWLKWNLAAISLSDGDKMYVKSDDEIPLCEYDSITSIYKHFIMTGSIAASGNIMSLLNFSTKMTDNAFGNLFLRCASLTSAPELPATKLTTACYSGMFMDCTSLTQAPKLPAKSVPNNGYELMFSGCTSLLKTPTLPATSVGASGYAGMFSGCTSITTAPELPATNLMYGANCYESMFYGCTSLVNAPELPATILGDNCYKEMFAGCTSLINAPTILPATALNNGCYKSMFVGCKLLVKAPELPATNLFNDCYNNMFSGCLKLNYVKALFNTIKNASCLSNWLYNVSSTGTFIKSKDATWADAGIPARWTIAVEGGVIPDPEPEREDYLCFTSTGDSTIQILQKGTPTDISNGKIFLYKVNNGEWSSLGLASNIYLHNGDKAYIKSDDIKPMAETSQIYKYFDMTGSIAASGNIMSLIAFSDTMAKECFGSLFYGCDSLTTAPELPATTLSDHCYYALFDGCTSLTTAPELPATTLTLGCYANMFHNCTSLAQSPTLPAITLAPSCYQQMFTGCTKLNYVKALFTDMSANNCVWSWLRNVSTIGTFVKNASATWNILDAGIPSGWTVEIDGAVTPMPGPDPDTKPDTKPDKVYLCFTSTGDSTVAIRQYGTPDRSANKVIKYKLNNGQWHTWDLSAVTLHDGGKMYLKSDDDIPISESWSIYKTFKITGSIAASGNIMSLFNFSDTLPDYAFLRLFNECTPLTSAPELPATTLTQWCYAQMFYGCSKLNYVKALFTDIPSGVYPFDNWLKNVSSTGTFVKNSAATWTNEQVGIPTGWTVQPA